MLYVWHRWQYLNIKVCVELHDTQACAWLHGRTAAATRGYIYKVWYGWTMLSQLLVITGTDNKFTIEM